MKDVIQALDEAPEEISPVLAIAARGKRVANNVLDEALTKAMDEEREIQRVINALVSGETMPARTVPIGF